MLCQFHFIFSPPEGDTPIVHFYFKVEDHQTRAVQEADWNQILKEVLTKWFSPWLIDQLSYYSVLWFHSVEVKTALNKKHIFKVIQI